MVAVMTGYAGQGSPENYLVAEVSMIGAVAQWCECLHGRQPLVASLELLALGLGAEIVAVVRYPRQSGSPGRTVGWDRAVAEVRGGRLDSGYARSLMGAYFDAARPGSLWFRSMVEEGATPGLTEFHAARQLRELAIIPLESNSRFIDMIELHFHDKLRGHQQVILNSLAPVLARTWQNRTQGLFTESLLREAPVSTVIDLAPILSVENPARLSRAEYRVSLMLSRGMSIEQVRTELRIRESTLRTHLGSLYAKTGCANLSELVFRLASTAPFGAATLRQSRSA